MTMTISLTLLIFVLVFVTLILIIKKFWPKVYSILKAKARIHYAIMTANFLIAQNRIRKLFSS